MTAISGVFFDVDFTLIYPGPMFRAEGYARVCAAHGLTVDRSRFSEAVRLASSILDEAQDHAYSDAHFVAYTRRIIEGMGGEGPAVTACAKLIYAEWAECQHFALYDDVVPVLQALVSRGVRIGLISNSHRSLSSFERHFALDGLIHTAVSSLEHGFMKPHRSIFDAALRQLDVAATEAVMVGDSYTHDIEGARAAGMRGVLVQRSPHETATPVPADVPVIRGLAELLPLIDTADLPQR